MKINLLGKDLIIKKLSVGDMLKLNNIDKEDEGTQLLKIVELSIVSPKYTFKKLYDLDVKYINDLTKIVEMSTGTEDDK